MAVTYRIKGDLAAARKPESQRRCGAPEPTYWQGPSQTHSLLSEHGVRATNVLVTSRERAWRAPSGKRAAGKPNTTLRTALRAGADRSGYVTAENVVRQPHGRSTLQDVRGAERRRVRDDLQRPVRADR